ncbi:MAG: hypothetical protein K6G66_05235 [Oscillospiraceae bacterium]|nr:hypothetical protein [Oscillospiraceae bacterium]
MKLRKKHLALLAALLLLAERGFLNESPVTAAAATIPPTVITSPAPTAGNSYTDNSSGGHAILVDAEQARYTNITVHKTGNLEKPAGRDGENAAVLAENGAVLELREVSVSSNGTGADAIFSMGAGTTLEIADSTVKTAGDFSDALVTADGGTLNAGNLVVRTAGMSSAAIRAGASMCVSGGTYDTVGVDSPAIYAASDLTVRDAELSSAAAQGVIVDGGGDVTLENVALTANHTVHTESSDETLRYQAVLLCASDEGEDASVFTMRGGSLTNLHGDVFLVSGAKALVNLTGAAIVNDDPEGAFLAVTDGGKAELCTAAQELAGDILTDEDSALDLHLWDGSVLTGAVNPENAGKASVELTDGAVWSLTGDSYIDSLRCEAGSIRLNGHTLTVGGEAYVEGTAVENAE